MKKLIVCGCSWMSVDTNNTSEYKGTHFSELLAEKLGYELIAYAKPGSSNGGICVQIEEAIRSKPDLIIFGQSVSDRVELRITEHIEHVVPWNHLNARDPEVKLSELLGEHAVNPTLMSDNLGSMLYDAKHQLDSAKWFHKNISHYGVDITQNHSNEIAEAVKDWFMHLYSPRMKNQIDMWTLYAVQHKLHLSGIPALKVIDLLHYDTPWYPCITKGYGPGDGYVAPTHNHGSYHTSIETQHDILRDIETALEHKYNNEI
jgi:hypothetical protein